jgi:hypothetical protein
MGSKAVVNKALEVLDQHNAQRFKCEQAHGLTGTLSSEIAPRAGMCSEIR